jgi:hypothetical protein
MADRQGKILSMWQRCHSETVASAQRCGDPSPPAGRFFGQPAASVEPGVHKVLVRGRSARSAWLCGTGRGASTSSYYFFVVLVVVVIRHKTTAAAPWALHLVVGAFLNDAIAVAVRAGLHVYLPGGAQGGGRSEPASAQIAKRSLPMCLQQRFNGSESRNHRACSRNRRRHPLWQFAVNHRGNEYCSHRQGNDEITSLTPRTLIVW